MDRYAVLHLYPDGLAEILSLPNSNSNISKVFVPENKSGIFVISIFAELADAPALIRTTLIPESEY